ncbi:MAG: response regulator [Pseudomonadota bacterium]|nr:response regulator [Pseudomonadota bacterium]
MRAARQELAMPDAKKPADPSTGWGLAASPKTIVVIDDERDNVDLTVMILESAGHTARGATEGRAGLKLAIEQLTHIVVLDHLMPDMNGAEVGKALRAHPVTRYIKILMHSGTPEATIRVSFTDYDAYLTKPAQGLSLLQAIEAL